MNACLDRDSFTIFVILSAEAIVIAGSLWILSSYTLQMKLSTSVLQCETGTFQSIAMTGISSSTGLSLSLLDSSRNSASLASCSVPGLTKTSHIYSDCRTCHGENFPVASVRLIIFRRQSVLYER